MLESTPISNPKLSNPCPSKLLQSWTVLEAFRHLHVFLANWNQQEILAMAAPYLQAWILQLKMISSVSCFVAWKVLSSKSQRAHCKYWRIGHPQVKVPFSMSDFLRAPRCDDPKLMFACRCESNPRDRWIKGFRSVKWIDWQASANIDDVWGIPLNLAFPPSEL